MPTISPNNTKRPASRVRDLPRRQTAWIRGTGGIAALGWLAVSTVLLTGVASAQMGQMGMAPGNGLVNRASNAFRDLNLNGPGFLYYGINAADRGLGYRGSYMTLGGFIPVVEDDLGGIWSTDLRSHLSNYGGFFSNVGAVRKQLLGGGSLLGFGVYWDYDGDQNQYSDQTIGVIDPVIFPGGFSYNQVGVSGEFLTDWGNLRSNGYIPVGSTGQSTGQFASDRILCMQGINAALGGADLEVGAYIPSLADWAGMVSVGGYAYGNTRYQLDNGATLVPWFGGVYTRLDLTLANNWDFSLQYNNDSYFDSTGFARLTYRLGGSRRRNVPDQMEQPMMRNEHIVRAHQTAVEARNPDTQLPWRVLHVDNAATGSTGTGTVTDPFTTMAAAEAVADREYDIVYVQGSNIPYTNVPGSPLFSFQANNQYLIGEGSNQTIPTVECGDLRVSPTLNPSLYPTLSPGPNATAILIDPGVYGQTINGFVINASSIGIEAKSSSAGTNTFSNITINGGRDGINVSGVTNYAMSNMLLNGQSTAGIANAGTGVIDFNNSTVQNVLGNGIDTSAGALNITNSTVAGSGANGILATGTGTSQVTVSQSTITDSGDSGIAVGQNANVTIAGSSLTANTRAGIETLASGTGTVVASNTRIDGTLATGRATNGVLMNGPASVNLQNSSIANTVTGVTISGAGQLTMGGGAGSSIANITANGLEISASLTAPNVAGSANLTNVSMQTIGGDGIVTRGGAAATNGGGGVSFVNSRMTGIGGTGITGTRIGNNAAPQGTGAVIFVENSSISDAANGGIQVTNSNLNVQGSEITNAGPIGIESIDRSTTLISDTTISGETTTGILASASNNLSWNGAATGDFNYLTATNNTITTLTNGILVQGAITTTAGTPNATLNSQGIVRANISLNTIDATNAIGLTTVGGIVGTAPATGAAQPPAVIGGLITGNGRPQGIQVAAQSQPNLEALNGGATVTETPAPPDPESVTTSVDYVPGLFVQPPPSP